MISYAAPTPSSWEDAILAWKLRAGSSTALARIYEKHRHDLLRVAAGLLANPGTAEDVVQDVFLRIARGPEVVKGGGNLRAFLCTCVANHARNTNRSNRTRAAEADIDPDQQPAGDPSPAHWLIQNDRLTALNDALAQLSYEQREAVVLHLQGGLRFREIAAATGVSLNTIQSRYRYGLEKLRDHLKEEQ